MIKYIQSIKESDKSMANNKNKLVDSKILENNFYKNIKNILQNARNNAYRQINFIMVEAYWQIGKQIVEEEEQRGKERAEYGKALIKELSKRLTKDFGKGFSKRNIYNMKKLYIAFPKMQTLSAQLTWSHYKLFIRVKDVSMKPMKIIFDMKIVN